MQDLINTHCGFSVRKEKLVGHPVFHQHMFPGYAKSNYPTYHSAIICDPGRTLTGIVCQWAIFLSISCFSTEFFFPFCQFLSTLELIQGVILSSAIFQKLPGNVDSVKVLHGCKQSLPSLSRSLPMVSLFFS